jgi:hypothetical protein
VKEWRGRREGEGSEKRDRQWRDRRREGERVGDRDKKRKYERFSVEMSCLQSVPRYL